MNAIHISTAQAMMLRPDPVDLVVFKSDGSLVHYPNVISRNPHCPGCLHLPHQRFGGVFIAKKSDFRGKKHFFCIFFKTVQSNWTLI